MCLLRAAAHKSLSAEHILNIPPTIKTIAFRSVLFSRALIPLFIAAISSFLLQFQLLFHFLFFFFFWLVFLGLKSPSFCLQWWRRADVGGGGGGWLVHWWEKWAPLNNAWVNPGAVTGPRPPEERKNKCGRPGGGGGEFILCEMLNQSCSLRKTLAVIFTGINKTWRIAFFFFFHSSYCLSLCRLFFFCCLFFFPCATDACCCQQGPLRAHSGPTQGHSGPVKSN